MPFDAVRGFATSRLRTGQGPPCAALVMLRCSLYHMAYPTSPPISKSSIQGGSSYRGYNQAASLVTALTGTNNDLAFTSKAAASSANSITVAYVVAGASTPLSVSVTGNAITVNVATSAGSAATSTAAQVAAAIAASSPATALVSAANAPGNDGTGVVTALAATALSGGTSRSIASGTGGFARQGVRGTNRARISV